MSTGSTRAVPAALAGATAISFSAILFRASDVQPITAGFYRMAFAVPVLALLWWSRRREDRRSGRERLIAFVAGLFLAADVVAWHTAIDLIGAGLGTLIANSQVVIVPMATWVLFRERPSRAALAAMPVVMIGLVLITGVGRADTFGERPAVGVALGAVAALMYTGFLVGYRRSNRRLAPPSGPLLEATAGAALGAFAAGAVSGQMDLTPGWAGVGWLVLLALSSQVVGWLAIGYALPRLPAAHTSFAILLQPSLTLVWGALIFGERASWVQAIGVLLVLAGITTVTIGSRQRAPVQRSASA